MIENVPAAADLETISRQLYFNAWSQVTEIVDEFRLVYGEDMDIDWAEEWKEYIESAQADLQGIFTLVQQSQEIGIKSLIARVSPFLLLKRHEARPIVPNTLQYDFSDFPTVDAGELVRVHNVFCDKPLSAEFAAQFETLRRGRNKIAHLGLFNEKLEPNQMVDVLFQQYAQLYPGRDWLPDWVLFSSKGRWAENAGYDKHWSAEGAVLDRLWRLLPELSDTQYEIVFGHGRDEQRYVCPECAHLLNRFNDGSSPAPGEMPTAFLGEDAMLTCAACQKQHQTLPHACNDPACKGALKVPSDYWGEICASCGGECAEVEELPTD